jgi:porphobilinogen synthase
MTNLFRKFPSTRLRRTRYKAGLRSLVAEVILTKDDLIQPIFIKEDIKGIEPIDSMPGINRFGLDSVNQEVKGIVSLGIKAIAVFPVISEEKKDSEGKEAINKNNLISIAVKQIKEEFPELIIIADVALDPYTDHGHDGILNEKGDVDNDKSLIILKEQALILAQAGTDVIAPSDMMDGRIAFIREGLEEAGFENIAICAYSAKYSSKFYGPFKDAVESAKFFGNKTKDTYQMAISNINEALHEVSMDINEGADIVMVKPGMPYLDVVKAVKDSFSMPTFVYQVSGEYAMMKAAIEKGWLPEEVIFESLLSFKRAGADCILTYAAKEIASKL